MAIVLDGTTGITTPSVASTGASTFTGALALPSGGLNVGSGQLAVDASGRVTMASQPAFLARPPTNFSVGGDTILTGFSVINNRSNSFNAVNGRFTAPVTGAYQFNLRVFMNSSNFSRLDLRINVNGAAYHLLEVQKWATNSNNSGQVMSCMVYMTSGDYAEMRVGTPTSGATTYIAASPFGEFSGFLIG